MRDPSGLGSALTTSSRRELRVTLRTGTLLRNSSQDSGTLRDLSGLGSALTTSSRPEIAKRAGTLLKDSCTIRDLSGLRPCWTESWLVTAVNSALGQVGLVGVACGFNPQLGAP